jgi:hypothetical protein
MDFSFAEAILSAKRLRFEPVRSKFVWIELLRSERVLRKPLRARLGKAGLMEFVVVMT